VSFETVLFEVQDGVARVTLNRPQVLNAYNIQMRDDLFEVFSAIRDDDEVRAVVIQGAGRGYCAGADLTEFGTAPSPTAARRIRFARDVWGVLRSIPCPRVAAMHGFAIGSGLEMALMCDLRIAASGTRFALPEVSLGLVPAAGGTQTLPRAIRPGAALDLLLTGRQIDTEEALRVGLVDRIVPSQNLEATVAALSESLRRLNPAVARATLRAVREGADMPLPQALRLEAQLAALIRREPTPGQTSG
jgi:enoyl-CoA hydratase/carnithine racemase